MYFTQKYYCLNSLPLHIDFSDKPIQNIRIKTDWLLLVSCACLHHSHCDCKDLVYIYFDTISAYSNIVQAE